MAKSKQLTRPKFREWLQTYNSESKVSRNGSTPVQKYMKQKGISSEVEMPKWAIMHSEVVASRANNSTSAGAALTILNDLD